MKKTIVSLMCCAFLSVAFFEIVSSNKTSEKHTYSLIGESVQEDNENLPEGYFEIEGKASYDHVYLNTISLEKTVLTKARIDKCQITISESPYKGGDTIPSNSSFNGVTYDSRIRINKYENSIIYGDLLDTTNIVFSIEDSPIPIDISSLSLQTKQGAERVPSTISKIVFEDGIIEMKALLENKGNLFSNDTIAATVKYKTVNLDGLFVKEEAVFQDPNGYFIQQIVYRNKNRYFKKTYISLLDEFGGFYKIQSDSQIAECLVCF